MTHTINRSALVHFTPRQMFDLVNDIEAYPHYMDGCEQAQVLARGDVDEKGHSWLEARLVLSKGGISQGFVTRNQLCPPESMTMNLVDGPFKQLQGCWRFTPLGDSACKVSFELSFELQNRLLGMAVGKLFESVAGKQVDALCARAQTIYGSKG